jgi:hypothetical protein
MGMAKLSAHGRELLRVEQESEVSNPESSTTWERITRTYHADGKILQKHDVKWKPDWLHSQGERYSYGWKLFGNLKKGIDPVAHVAKVVAGLREKGEASKWKIVHGGPPVVVVSQARIMRAVESGESIGFCKECGHSQDGCEPDARGYKCESCGAMGVYGAEEMLISA